MVIDMICCDCGSAFPLDRKHPVVRGLEIVMSLVFMGLLGTLGFLGISTLVSEPKDRENPIPWVLAGLSVLALVCLYWFFSTVRSCFNVPRCPDCRSSKVARTRTPEGRAALDHFDPHPSVLGTKGVTHSIHGTVKR